MLRYWPRISCRVWRLEYSIASFASMILRSRFCFGLAMQRLRTSCWVIVEPPSTGFAGFEVLERGADDALGVDAAVLVEALVLDRHRRQLQALRDPLDRDRRARFVGGDHPELAAVGGVEGRVAAAVDRLAGGERGRVGGDVEHPGGDGDRPRSRSARRRRRRRAAACCRSRRGVAGVAGCAASSRQRVLRRRRALRPACRRSSGCGRRLRPAAGWGSRQRLPSPGST